MFKRRLIAADQASVFMAMTFEQRSSSLVLHQMTSDHNRSELRIQDHSNEQSSSKLVPKVVPLAVKTATSQQELELLFHHHLAMLRTTVNTSSTDSQMHNNIMADGSKERPPMLGPGRYSQWRSRFLRYIDTKANGKYLRKCIFDGPYKLTSVVIEAVATTVNAPAVPEHDEAETIHNMSEENKLYVRILN
ncbi:hypothetical protein Tco_0932530 [Tanacetum coccineum]